MTAVAYARRFEKQGGVTLWFPAETPEELSAALAAVAVKLRPSAQGVEKQDDLVQVTHGWLRQNQNWLVILDNADEASVITLLGPRRDHDRILLTGRSGIVREYAHGIEVDAFSPEMGARFLLWRSGQITGMDETEVEQRRDWSAAVELVRDMDGLPLALDQAAAEMEVDGMDAVAYRIQFERVGLVDDSLYENRAHASVARTFTLAFERLEREHPATAELLRFCALLAPEEIPVELFEHGADFLPALLRNCKDGLRLTQFGRPAIKAAVLSRAPGGSFFLHRVVRLVLRNSFSVDKTSTLRACVVATLDKAWPDEWNGDFELGKKLFSHSRDVLADVPLEADTAEIASLANYLGAFLYNAGSYTEAETLLRRSVASQTRLVGTQHSETARSMNNLGILLRVMGKRAEGARYQREALVIRQKLLGPEHTDTASSLFNVADCLRDQAKYSEAETLYRQVLDIKQSTRGDNHREIAISLIGLASTLEFQGRYGEAVRLGRRSLEIMERIYGPDHSETAASVSLLASILQSQGHYGEAEPLSRRSMKIKERVLGSDHPQTALIICQLASIQRLQRRYEEAERLCRRSLEIQERVLGSDHPDTATSLLVLADILLFQGRCGEAEPLCRRSLKIRERVLGPDHPDTATSLDILACILLNQRRFVEAEKQIRRSLKIEEGVLGPDHPNSAKSLGNLSIILCNTGRIAEGLRHLHRATQSLSRSLGKTHPTTKHYDKELRNALGLTHGKSRGRQSR